MTAVITDPSWFMFMIQSPGRSGSAETDLSNRFKKNHFENVKLKPDRFPKLQKLVKPDQNRFFWGNNFLQN